jgi:hypothetical protein
MSIKKFFKLGLDILTNPITNNFGTFLFLIILQSAGGVVGLFLVEVINSRFGIIALTLETILYAYLFSYTILLIRWYLHWGGREVLMLYVTISVFYQLALFFCFFYFHIAL